MTSLRDNRLKLPSDKIRVQRSFTSEIGYEYDYSAKQGGRTWSWQSGMGPRLIHSGLNCDILGSTTREVSCISEACPIHQPIVTKRTSRPEDCWYKSMAPMLISSRAIIVIHRLGWSAAATVPHSPPTLNVIVMEAPDSSHSTQILHGLNRNYFYL